MEPRSLKEVNDSRPEGAGGNYELILEYLILPESKEVFRDTMRIL